MKIKRTLQRGIVCLLLALASVPLMPQTIISAMTEPYGLPAVSAISRLPYINAQSISGQSTSYDRTDANDDGFSGKGFLYASGTTDQVIADVKGPGEITRIWFAGLWDAKNTIIKMYFDGASTPAVSMTMQALFSGTTAPFLSPLVEPPAGSAGGFSDYLPMPFQTSVKVVVTPATTNPNQPGYVYAVDYRQYPGGTPITTWTGSEDSSAARNIWSNVATDPKGTSGNTIVTGSTTVPSNGVQTLLDVSGPHSISSIKLTIPGVPGDETNTYAEDILNNLHIRIFWDNQATPGVDAPIGSFFGIGTYGAAHVTRALLFGLDAHGALYMYYPMPFAQHATIQLYSNRGVPTSGITYEIQHQAFTNSFANVGYFTTAYHVTRARATDPFDYVALDATGSGKLVGLEISGSGSPDPTSSYSDQEIHYMEGDNHIYVDGSQTPQWNGTGTEDFFDGAGYFCCTNGQFVYPANIGGWAFYSNPLNGFTNREFSPVSVNATGNMAMYRSLVQDAVNFRNHIRVSFEHGGGIRQQNQNGVNIHFGNQNAEFSTLAYYYYKPTVMSYLTDTLNVGDPASRNAHSYTNNNQTWSGSHTYSYEGDLDAITSTVSGLSNKGYSQFTLAVDPANQGVVLRRTFDQSVFSMNANVYVNAQLVAPWYVAGGNPFFSWRDNDLFIPPQFTQGQSHITVKIQFVSSTNDWDEFGYQAYSVVGGATSAQPPIGNGVTFMLSALCSHLTLDVGGGATAPGSSVVQAISTSGDSQMWRAIALPGGYDAFVNVNSGLVLDVQNGSATPGSAVQLSTWTGAPSQQWSLTPAATAGYFIVKNRNSGLPLDVVNGSAQPGGAIQQYTENGGASQQWLLERQDPPAPLPIQSGFVYRLNARVSGLNLDLVQGAAQPGQAVQQYIPGTTCAQEWRMTSVGSEVYTLTSTCGPGTLVLDTKGQAIAPATTLVVATLNGATTQQWRIELVKDGYSDSYYRLINVGSGLALDVVNGSLQPGPVQIYTWGGSVSQLWRLTPVDTQSQPVQSGRWYEISALASSGSNVTLDVQNGSAGIGATVQQYTVNHSCSQEWRADYVTNGYYRLVNQCSDKVLGVPNAAMGTIPLQTWDWNGSDAELWEIQAAATSGYVTVINKGSGLAMDLANASPNPGTPVQQYTSNAGPSQQWQFHLEP